MLNTFWFQILIWWHLPRNSNTNTKFLNLKKVSCNGEIVDSYQKPCNFSSGIFTQIRKVLSHSFSFNGLILIYSSWKLTNDVMHLCIIWIYFVLKAFCIQLPFYFYSLCTESHQRVRVKVHNPIIFSSRGFPWNSLISQNILILPMYYKLS